MIEPAYLSIPPRKGSFGDEAVDLVATAGLILDEEQRLAVDAFLSYGPGGQWVALEQAIKEPRQNGKTTSVAEPVTAFDFFLLEPDRIVWTAHVFKTCRDAFADFERMIEASSVMSRRVKKISHAPDDLHIELHNGARMDFLARAGGGGRGLKGKRVVMDEALYVQAVSMGALLPILSTRKGAQITYASSAGKETSDHLGKITRRGRRGGDPSLIYVEWCAPGGWDDPGCTRGAKCLHEDGTDGCELDNEEHWARANHSLGTRITVEYVRDERRALSPREFGRERLGWDENLLSGERPIGEKAWNDLIDIMSKAVDPVAVGLHVNNDRSASALGIAGYRSDGLIHLEVVKSAAGVAWTVPDLMRLVERAEPLVVVLDDKSETASLLPDLKKAGLHLRDRDPDVRTGGGDVDQEDDDAEAEEAEAEGGDEGAEVAADEQPVVVRKIVVTTWANDLAKACGALHTRVTETKEIRHLNQPELNDSLKGAAWRQLGNARAWDLQHAETNQAPLMAVTEALHGLLTYGSSGPVAMDGDLMA